MKDPAPENIAGRKTVAHSVNHEIQWGYVAVGVGLVVVGLSAYTLLSGDDDDGQEGLPTA